MPKLAPGFAEGLFQSRCKVKIFVLFKHPDRCSKLGVMHSVNKWEFYSHCQQAKEENINTAGKKQEGALLKPFLLHKFHKLGPSAKTPTSAFHFMFKF